MIDPTKGWDKYMFIRDSTHNGPNLKNMAHDLLDMKNRLNGERNDCPEWDTIATEILESMSNGDPVVEQRDKIKKVVAHTKTCQHDSCVRARKLLPEEFFKNVTDEDMT